MNTLDTEILQSTAILFDALPSTSVFASLSASAQSGLSLEEIVQTLTESEAFIQGVLGGVSDPVEIANILLNNLDLIPGTQAADVALNYIADRLTSGDSIASIVVDAVDYLNNAPDAIFSNTAQLLNQKAAMAEQVLQGLINSADPVLGLDNLVGGALDTATGVLDGVLGGDTITLLDLNNLLGDNGLLNDVLGTVDNAVSGVVGDTVSLLDLNNLLGNDGLVGGVLGTVSGLVDGLIGNGGLLDLDNLLSSNGLVGGLLGTVTGLVDGLTGDLLNLDGLLADDGLVGGLLNTVSGLVDGLVGNGGLLDLDSLLADDGLVGGVLNTVTGLVGGLLGGTSDLLNLDGLLAENGLVGGVLNTVTGLVDGLVGNGGLLDLDSLLADNGLVGGVLGTVTDLVGGLLGSTDGLLGNDGLASNLVDTLDSLLGGLVDINSLPLLDNAMTADISALNGLVNLDTSVLNGGDLVNLGANVGNVDLANLIELTGLSNILAATDLVAA